MTGNLGEKTPGSCGIVTFKRIERTPRICRVGVIDDFDFPFLSLCIIYIVPINRVWRTL
jgi:hypothetical protein